jgi:hypothetical protein
MGGEREGTAVIRHVFVTHMYRITRTGGRDTSNVKQCRLPSVGSYLVPEIVKFILLNIKRE